MNKCILVCFFAVAHDFGVKRMNFVDVEVNKYHNAVERGRVYWYMICVIF